MLILVDWLSGCEVSQIAAPEFGGELMINGPAGNAELNPESIGILV